jgi:hypothetical protein
MAVIHPSIGVHPMKPKDMIAAHDLVIDAREHLLERYGTHWHEDACYRFVQFTRASMGSIEFSQVQGDYAACRILESMHSLIAYT